MADSQPTEPEPEINQRANVIVALASRRYIIIRHDDPCRVRSAERFCRPIEKLRPGEAVYYNGAVDRVRAIGAY